MTAMIAFEMLITRLTRGPIQINRDLFVERIDWVGASNLKRGIRTGT